MIRLRSVRVFPLLIAVGVGYYWLGVVASCAIGLAVFVLYELLMLTSLGSVS
jgi:hypothetical protein